MRSTPRMSDDRIRIIFNEAVDKPASARGAFLDEACGDDAALRAEIESLLAHHATEIVSPTEVPTMVREGDRIGPYTILSVLGEGGFGIVYLAKQTSPIKRRVALKVLKAGMDSRQIIARFEAERQALAIMNHPGIAKIHDAGITDQGRPFFAMEYIKGLPITEACDRHRLTIHERLSLMAEVCDAVHHAHTKGVIHRDLKPGNVLVRIDDSGRLKPTIIDFGVAKATSLQLADMTIVTIVGQIIGTPAYMSPEQADLRSTDIDTRSDIYALGIMLYEVLTGSPPFLPSELSGSGLDAMKRIICEQAPPRPSTRITSLDANDASTIAAARRMRIDALAGTLRKELEWIPLKAIRKVRANRYDSARSMAADIRRYLAGDPLEAGPETALYRLRKSIRRNRIAWLTGCFIVLLLSTATVLFLVLWQDAAHQAELAQQRAAELDRRQRVLTLLDNSEGALEHELKQQHPKLFETRLAQRIQGLVAATTNDPLTRIELLGFIAGERTPGSVAEASAPAMIDAWLDAKRMLQMHTREPGSADPERTARLALANLKITAYLMNVGARSLSDVRAAQADIPIANRRLFAEGLMILAGRELRSGPPTEPGAEPQGVATTRRAVAMLQELPDTELMQARSLRLLVWYYKFRDVDTETAYRIHTNEVMPLMEALYAPDDIQLRMAAAMMLVSTAADQFISPERLAAAKTFIDQFRVIYGDTQNTTWQQMNNVAIYHAIAAQQRREAGDIDAAIQAERDGADLFDKLLREVGVRMFMRSTTAEWYLDNYRYYLPEYAPTEEAWEAWLKSTMVVPSRRPEEPSASP